LTARDSRDSAKVGAGGRRDDAAAYTAVVTERHDDKVIDVVTNVVWRAAGKTYG
jgi:hypothetical protein